MLRVTKDNPDFLTAHYKLWWTYSAVGDTPHAFQEFLSIARLVGTADDARGLEHVYQKSGYSGTLKAFASTNGTDTSANTVDSARCMTIVGDKPAALHFLERGLKSREGWMIFVASDPVFDSLRSEPEYARLLKEIHPPAETIQ